MAPDVAEHTWDPKQAAPREQDGAGKTFVSSEDGIRDDTGSVVATPPGVGPHIAAVPGTAAPAAIDYDQLAAAMKRQGIGVLSEAAPAEHEVISPDGTQRWDGQNWVQREQA